VSDPGDHLEIEQKFDVDDGFRLPDFGAIPGIAAADPVVYHLSATYYDTADTLLAAARITLRRRTGGTDAGWHLKLPAAQGARHELQEPLSDEIPGRFAGQVAEVTGGAALAPVATLDTERTVVTLTADGTAGGPPRGTVVAEVADDEVTARRLAGPRAGRTLRWREVEVEVEVPRPAPEFQGAAAALLFAAGARPAAKGSKLARVLDS
jgi:inorganic triphosphatase YgiF